MIWITIVTCNILEFGPWLASTFISIIWISGLVSPPLFSNQNIRVWRWRRWGLRSSSHLFIQDTTLNIFHSYNTTGSRISQRNSKSFSRVEQSIKKPKSLNFFIELYTHSRKLAKNTLKIINMIRNRTALFIPDIHQLLKQEQLVIASLRSIKCLELVPQTSSMCLIHNMISNIIFNPLSDIATNL